MALCVSTIIELLYYGILLLRNLILFLRTMLDSKIIHGFGYDEIRDDYKIIQRVEYMGDYLQVEPFVPYWDIYSLKSNSWKKTLC